jgi:hypothetical protein
MPCMHGFCPGLAKGSIDRAHACEVYTTVAAGSGTDKHRHSFPSNLSLSRVRGCGQAWSSPGWRVRDPGAGPTSLDDSLFFTPIYVVILVQKSDTEAIMHICCS